MATGGREESQANGTLVPNRIFVGGLTSKTNEEDLRNLFSMYGNVKATKIIFDRNGSSKGYGFVSFETEEEARKILSTLKGKDLFLKERKLNVATAIKKHPYSRNREPGSLNGASLVWSSNPLSGSSVFPGREHAYYQQATWPLLWHQPMYLPQQYQYSQLAQPGYPQYVYNVPPDYQCLGNTQAQGSDFSETASADSSDSGRNRSRPSTPAPSATEYDRNRPLTKPCQDQNVCLQKTGPSCTSQSAYAHSTPVQPLHHHVLAKTLNGVTLMAYPAQYVMGSPALVQMKQEGTSDSDNVMFDMQYLHSQMASGALTPPATPMASMSCDFNASASMESARKG